MTKLWTKLAILIKTAARGSPPARPAAPPEAPSEAPPVLPDDRAQSLQEERVADMLRDKLAAAEPDAQRNEKGD